MVTETWKGAPTTFEAFFYTENGDPVIPQNSVLYRVLDFNRNLILSGYGAQTIDAPERWSAVITIPTNAPSPPPGKKYSIVWQLTSNDGKFHSSSEYFQLNDNVTVSNASAITEIDTTSSIIMEVSDFEDGILLPRKPTELTLSLYMYENNSPIYTAVIDVNLPAKEDVNGLYYFHPADLTDIPDFITSNIGLNGFLSIWKYKYANDLRSSTETHVIYIVNQKYISMIHQVKKEVDHASDLNIEKQYVLSEVDLLHFLLVGLQRVNETLPSITNYTIDYLPPSLSLLVTKAAAYEALNALYLAKGLGSFDFSGQATTLNVDHTQYIEAQLGRLDAYLTASIPSTKRLLIRRSSPGTLGVSANPMMTIPGRVNVSSIIRLMNQFSNWGNFVRVPGAYNGIP